MSVAVLCGEVVVVVAVELGLALWRAVGVEVGESRDTDESFGGMLACWIVGWFVGSGVGMVDVLSDGGWGRSHGWMACLGWSGDLSMMKEERCGSSWSASVMLYRAVASWMVRAERRYEKKWMVYTH